MRILVDHREQAGGLLDRLRNHSEINVTVACLKSGDYLVNETITVERKQANDFALSIIDGRLFRQAARLKQQAAAPIVLIEGNPYQTTVDLHRHAVRGALVCLAATWQLPILFSKSLDDSVELLLMLGNQLDQATGGSLPRFGYRPRRLASRQLHIVQGLPGIGPKSANRLLSHFGSVALIMAASADQLRLVEGIGAGKAAGFRFVLDAPYEPGK
jgi:Fanconi anemia group M protein